MKPDDATLLPAGVSLADVVALRGGVAHASQAR